MLKRSRIVSRHRRRRAARRRRHALIFKARRKLHAREKVAK